MAEWNPLLGIIPSMLINQQPVEQTVQQPIAPPSVWDKPQLLDLLDQSAERLENGSKYKLLQPKPYTLTERTTTEYLTGEDLVEYKGLAPAEQLDFAREKFDAPGQTVLFADPSGKVELNDYFKAYNTPEDFDQDFTNLLVSRHVGQMPMTDKQYAKNLETWYATYARKNKKTGKLEKAYAEDLLGTKNRANTVRTVLLDPYFQDLNQQQQAAFLAADNIIHNSFKSAKLKKAEEELRKAEKELNAVKKLRAQTAINIAHKKVNELFYAIGEIKSSGAGVDLNKVQQMQKNVQRAWDAAKNISAKLNNNVSPEILFAQMAIETYYFTKPIADNNLTSIKITGADRAELKRQRQQKEYEQKLLSIFPDIL